MAHAEKLVGGGHSVSASKEERRPKKKKLHRISVERAKNGGHSVHHSYRTGGDYGYEPDTTHVFGKKDGPALLAHLRKHLGIQSAPEGNGNALAEAAGVDAGDMGEETEAEE